MTESEFKGKLVPQPGPRGDSSNLIFTAQGLSLFLRLLKGRVQCHNVTGILPFFQATRHLENSVFWWSSGWKQDIIQPYEKIAGSRVKTFQRKTLTVTMKIFSQHIIKLALGKSTQNAALRREAAQVSSPQALLHSWTASGGGWREALRHPSSLPGKMNRGKARSWSFRLTLVLSDYDPFGSVPIMHSGIRQNCSSRSQHTHVCLSVKSPWFSNSCGFTAVKTETS